MTSEHTLLSYAGSGAAIVECAFAWAKLPVLVEDVDTSPESPTRARLMAVNPLVQVPVLLLPDGSVLTQSLAILHYIQDRAPGSGLIPTTDLDVRARFYRWAVFLVSAVYPTFTYGDEPGQWVSGEPAVAQLRESTDQHRQSLWQELEAAARAPWFLGEERSAIDLYIAVMRHWRPRAAWFDVEAPKLTAIAHRVAALPELAPILARHFQPGES